MADITADSHPILKQLRVISRVLTLANAAAIQAELEKVVTTTERKIAWVLMDGKRTVPEIAPFVKQTPRAVNMFVAAAVDAGLVESAPGKPPVRLLDYVPPKWIELADRTKAEQVAPTSPDAGAGTQPVVAPLAPSRTLDDVADAGARVDGAD